MANLVFLESVRKMPLMELPVRSTYVQLNDKGVLISPGSCLDVGQLQALNMVTDLVAPNLLHRAGIPKASSIFPKAKIWGPVGALEHRSKINWSDELSAEKWAFQADLPLVAIQGMPKVNEVVFFHRASKSLIVTDLCFNLTDIKGVGPWLILNLFGTYKKLGVSKFFLKFVSDKIAFEKSLEEIFSFDFENIILSHGANVMGEAKEKLRRAFLDRGLRLR